MSDQVKIEIETDDNELILRNQTFTDEYDLPSTVTRLKLKNSNVYIVGTAHFSEESIEDVSRTISTVKPKVVLLELCESRQHVLKMDQKKLLKEFENINLAKMKLSIKQNGVLQGCLHILMLYMSANVAKQLKMAPGGEFKQAFQEAELLNNGCKVILGDRDISITFKRALNSLSFFQKVRFVSSILFESDSITKEDVEKSKNKDMLEDMMQEMSKNYPQISRVFIEERDLYLVDSMRMCESIADNADIVAVVGIGHVKGIVKNWTSEINNLELIRIPEGSKLGAIVKWTILISTVGGISYGVYRLITNKR